MRGSSPHITAACVKKSDAARPKLTPGRRDAAMRFSAQEPSMKTKAFAATLLAACLGTAAHAATRRVSRLRSSIVRAVSTSQSPT